jgi:hypothetical protein
MRGISLKFEFRILLVFTAILLAALFLGSGSLSFAEAKSKATEDRSAFDPGQLNRLEKYQARFAKQAFPHCLESAGMAPDSFAVVIEVGSNGQVARSWRQGDSDFVICVQQLLTENFVFVSIGRPFFTLFEDTPAS